IAHIYSAKIYSLYKKLTLQEWVLTGMTTLYCAYFTYFTIQKHHNFFTGRFDLGNMDQTVWNSIHGRIFLFTNPDGTDIISRLAFHADFILILLSPLYLIWSDPRMLLITQTVIIASGAFFVYKIGQTIIGNNSI